MKILLATYWPLPHLGGVWPFMTQIKHRLEKLGHTVDLMGNGPENPKYHLVYGNKEIDKERILPLLRAKLNEQTAPLLSMDSWIQNMEMDRYCMELSAAYFGVDQYDIIHAQDVIAARSLSRVKPKTTPLVASIHGSLAREVMMALSRDMGDDKYKDSLMWKYYWSLEHLGAVSSDITLTSTEWLRRILVHDFAIPDNHIQTFQYGLDTDGFWQKSARGTDVIRPGNKKVIICPARLVFIKGIHFLVEALGKLKQLRSDWVCWLVGDGDKRSELEQRARELGIADDVVFLGHRDDVPALMQLADIFAHPSVQDNQPFSVMEAQVSGKPSVVSDAGGLPEIVDHGHTGLVSPVGDTELLYQHLNFLLEHDAVRQAMGSNAKAWGDRHWSMDQMIERLLAVYEAARRKVNERRTF